MGLYCGIALHSNNHVVTVINEEDRRLYERRLPNDLAITKTDSPSSQIDPRAVLRLPRIVDRLVLDLGLSRGHK